MYLIPCITLFDACFAWCSFIREDNIAITIIPLLKKEYEIDLENTVFVYNQYLVVYRDRWQIMTTVFKQKFQYFNNKIRHWILVHHTINISLILYYNFVNLYLITMTEWRWQTIWSNTIQLGIIISFC